MTDIQLPDENRRVPEEPTFPVQTGRTPGHARVDPIGGLMRELSAMFSLRLTPEMVDKTGRAPKLTLQSTVTYTVAPDTVRGGGQMKRDFTKPIFMEVGIPSSPVINSAYGEPSPYAHPAVLMASYNVEGGYKDASRHIAFYNRVNTVAGCYGTAAAFQMALIYARNYVLPSLGMGGHDLVFPEVEADGDNFQPGPEVTSFMPNELTMRHNNTVLNILYHVLEARDVLGAAGMNPNVKRVLNRCGRLPATHFNIEDFLEVFYILKFSLCGDQHDNQFVCDFNLALAQLFPVHGNCYEGGIWRELFSNLVVRENSVVVTSNVQKGRNKFGVVSDSALFGAALNLHCIVSRAILEHDLDARELVLPPGASNDMAREVLMYFFEPIYVHLTMATNVAEDYWKTQLANSLFVDDVRNRHLRDDRATFLGDFCPFVASYCTNISGNKLGACSFDKTSNQPLTFTGEYSTRRYDDDGYIDYRYDIHERRDFTNGLLYLDPKINPRDGLMNLRVAGFVAKRTGRVEDQIELVSGQIIEAGHDYGEYMWRNNGDILPCAGEVRAIDDGWLLLEGGGVQKWVEGGSYSISVSRYVSVGVQIGEARKPGCTRRSLIEKRFGNTYDMLSGVTEYNTVDIDEFTKNFLKLSVKKRKIVKARIEAEKRHNDKVVRNIVRNEYNDLDISDERIAEAVDTLVNAYNEVDVAASRIANVVDDIALGEKSAVSKVVAAGIKSLIVAESSSTFTAVGTDDILAATPSDAAQPAEMVYGFATTRRKWDVDRYLTSLVHVTAQFAKDSERERRRSLSIIANITDPTVTAEAEARMATLHAANWAWQEEASRSVGHALASRNAPSELASVEITRVLAERSAGVADH